MTPRTPAAIFEEVLDLWDDRESGMILLSYGIDQERPLAAHLAQVRAYREEFREAMERDAERLLQTAASFEDRADKPEEEEAHIPATLQPADVIDLMEALKASLRKATPPSWPLQNDTPESLAREKAREEEAVNAARSGDLAHGGIPPEGASGEPDPDLLRALTDSLAMAERRDERAERLSKRYTKDDGSAR